uniref:G-protein coupled receptors family 1 profile domain-containing protein n=1 Tax=Anabas testudineus TaxID=64144 RepID=A0A3Q1GW99_ANATE
SFAPFNVSSHKHFILDGFNELGALRPFLFIPFFTIFIISLSANSGLLYIVISERSLHSPMYILIAGMAFVDLSLPLFFVPNMLLSFLFDWRGISLIGCLVQMHFIHFFGTFQSTLLVWMALDRYFAICTPLYYHEHMSLPTFLKFIIPLVLRNFLMITLIVSLAGKLSFCASNVINHCFCEHMALVELACGSITFNNLVGLISVFLILVFDFLFTITSYIVIFSSMLRSGLSGAKALHTCITHIVVITVSLIIVLTAFLSFRIRNDFPAAIRVFFSTMYPLFPSCFNPIIYGIRTTEIRQHIWGILMCCCFVKTIPHSQETKLKRMVHLN